MMRLFKEVRDAFWNGGFGWVEFAEGKGRHNGKMGLKCCKAGWIRGRGSLTERGGFDEVRALKSVTLKVAKVRSFENPNV